METRMGHYGEWANAFTCLCVALGFEARLCVDTDNCFTEVFNHQEQRWVHLDCQKQLYDTPLFY